MCSAFAGCDKMPANGDLDGMWQMIEVEHGGVSKNVSADQLYMSIQLHLFQLGDKKNGRRYYGYFEHKGDSLRLWQFSYASQNETAEEDNVPIAEADKAILQPWGFYSLKETFLVDKLTKDILIMHNDSAKIQYIKF